MTFVTTVIIVLAGVALVGAGIYGISDGVSSSSSSSSSDDAGTPTLRPSTASPTPVLPGTPTLTPTTQPPTDPLKPLNVVLIIADDFNTDISHYGKEYMYTPALDSIGQNGVSAINAHCQVAVCSPSRASFMTSILPQTDDVYTFVTTPDVNRMTLQLFLRENGYTTYATGKIFHKNKAANANPNFEQVMDTWINQFDHTYLMDPGVGECPPCTATRTDNCGRSVTEDGGGNGSGGGCRIKNG